MDEKKVNPAPEESTERDKELFDALRREKKRKKTRRIIIVAVIVAALALAIFFGVRAAKNKVNEAIGSMNSTAVVSEATVTTGSISTTVSGSGMLSDSDTTQIVLPKGVKLEKILVKAGETVKKGDDLATVDISSVMSAMSDTQAELDKLDEQLRTAANETVSSTITSGVNGRVKIIYAQKDDDVAACMTENSALCVISLDGYMALDIDAGSLTAGDAVTAVVDGKTYKASVEKTEDGKAVILVPDNGPAYGASAEVQSADGTKLGEGTLYIHNPLRITGYAGVISRVNVAENQQVYANSTLFTLTDTAYTANYESVLKTRREKEEDLLALINMYSAGAVTAPFDGSVSSIDYSDKTTSGTDTSTTSYDTTYSYSGTTDTTDTTTDATGETKLLTLSSDTSMKLTVSVDETEILSVENGQQAQITVSSIGSDVFSGVVTAVERSAKSDYGVTNYSVEITLSKDPRMLSGMTATALIRIEGVDNALLIPESAVRQTRDSAYVYTTYDAETGTLGGETAVITGLTGGSMVEITDGLTEGQTVYYYESTDYYYYYDYGSDGDAAWVEDTSSGDAAVDASDGDADAVSEDEAVAPAGTAAP
jgi:HlyD family secretion protein